MIFALTPINYPGKSTHVADKLSNPYKLQETWKLTFFIVYQQVYMEWGF